MRAPIALFAALTCASAASGCATVAVAGAAGVGLFAAQERTIGQGIDDSTGSADLKSKLLRTDAKAFGGVDVEVAEGRALLTGSVATPEQKIEAERLAWTVRQIRAVANEIEVGAKPGMMRTAMDEWITTEVRARMVAEPTVRAIDINIETHKGVVYLMGLVTSQEQLQRAAETASLVRGVQRVVSYMQVREAPEIDAARLRTGAPITMAGQPVQP